jgi:hypothetical protein
MSFRVRLRAVNASAAETTTIPTPILDRISPFPAPAKPSFWAQLPALVILIAILYVLPGLLFFGRGAFFDSGRHWVVGNIHDLFAGDWAGFWLIFTGFAIALACLATVAVHEGAHLVTGLAMGFRFEFVQVGRTKFDRSFQPSRIPSPDEPRLGAVCFFPDGMKHHPWRCFFMVLAGPSANLITGLAVLQLPFQKSFVSGAFILASLLMGILNASPYFSDGRHLLTLLLRRTDHEGALALGQLYEQLHAGVELEALSPALIAEATLLKEKSPRTVLAHRLAYSAAFSRRDYAAAAALLEMAFAWSPWATEAIRQGLIYCAVVMQAKRGRIETAEKWFADLPPNCTKQCRLQAEAAILEGRGDIKGALAKIVECEQHLLEEGGEEGRKADLKKLRSWKADLENSPNVKASSAN